jgi:transcriptional regulator with XRE-family HTH domain
MQKQYSKTNIEHYVIDRVKEMRVERKISQLKLANLLELSPGFIADVESPNRRAKYNINHLNKLVRIFDCQFQDFFPTSSLKELEM